MEKAKAELAKQEKEVEIAESRFKFSNIEAVRLRAEATRIEQEAGAALEIERVKLLKCERNVLAAETALLFAPDTKLVFTNPALGTSKSYSTYMPDGKAIRFAVKSIAYPLEVKDGVIIDWAKPTVDKCANFATGVKFRKYGEISYVLAKSNIPETYVYGLLANKKLEKSSFPIHYDTRQKYLLAKLSEHDVIIVFHDLKWDYPRYFINSAYVICKLGIRTGG